METITLYHGTTGEAAESIKADGFIYGPAYFSPSRDGAENYATLNDFDAGRAVIIKIELPLNILNIDNESYNGDDLETALQEEIAVYVDGNVSIENAEFLYIGYEYE